MPTLELTHQQVVDLVRQLPSAQKREVLLALAGHRREQRMAFAEEQLRRLCADRGLNWDAMGDDEREAFVDDLVHEDRSCAQ
jgi:hypothetical protein